MAIETHEIKLTDKKKKSVNIICSDFPARKGLAIAQRLGELVTPLLSIVDSKNIKSKSISLMDIDVNMSTLADALSKSIGDPDLLHLIMDLMSFTRVDGQEVNIPEVFDIVFAGNYELLFKVLKFILEVNFKSFFGGEAIGKILSKMTIA